MAGNAAVSGTGMWTQFSGTALTIIDPTNPTTLIAGGVAGTYEFDWVISSGSCVDSMDRVEVVIQSNCAPVIVN